jgi:ribosomal protein L37E
MKQRKVAGDKDLDREDIDRLENKIESLEKKLDESSEPEQKKKITCVRCGNISYDTKCDRCGYDITVRKIGDRSESESESTKKKKE